MARIRMVTRTVFATKVQALCLNTVTAEVEKLWFTLTGEVADTDLLKLTKKFYETETLAITKIIDKDVDEVLYGMPEVDFIKLAKILPPRTTAKAD